MLAHLTDAGVWLFLALTFLISLLCGSLAFAIGRDRTFESGRALPFLFITIWSPNIAAVLVWHSQDTLGDSLKQLSRLGTPGAWALALAPLAVAMALSMKRRSTSAIPAKTALFLVVMNLAMGPMSEELGWRGFLLPALSPQFGYLGAALAVGVIWAVWHAPLWLLPSPQRAIPFPIFFATVVCFSLIVTAAWQAGGAALWPVVLFHLVANVGVAILELRGILNAADAYRVGLPYYALVAVACAAWLGA